MKKPPLKNPHLQALLEDLEAIEGLAAWVPARPVASVPRKASSRALRDYNTCLREAKEALGAAQIRRLAMQAAKAEAHEPPA